MFNTVGLIVKPKDPTSRQVADKLSKKLGALGKTILRKKSAIERHADLIVVAGGDGTILNTARSFANHGIPILGVNLGRIGFMADVSVDGMDDAIEKIMNGDFIREKRHLLSCRIIDENRILARRLAFNEAALHRNETPRMIEFEVSINEKFVNTQRADGLIIATPTGSTAYALSSGGPIIHPQVSGIGLVSICPHTMSHRPLLVDGNSEISVVLKAPDYGANVSFDGQSLVAILPHQKLIVRQHKNPVFLVHPKGYDYFQIIRSKLRWGDA